MHVDFVILGFVVVYLQSQVKILYVGGFQAYSIKGVSDQYKAGMSLWSPILSGVIEEYT